MRKEEVDRDVEEIAANPEDNSMGPNISLIQDIANIHTLETGFQAEKSTPIAVKKNEKKEEVNTDLRKKYGKKKAKKIVEGEYVVEDGKVWDMSLLGAIFSTVWMEWTLCVVLNSCAGMFYFLHLLFTYHDSQIDTPSILTPATDSTLHETDKWIIAALQVTAPLVTKQIITQLELAYYAHQAAQAGLPADLVPAPNSIGYGIGLAFALFVMEMASSLFNYQAQQRASVIGFKLRGSVCPFIDCICKVRLTGFIDIVDRFDLAEIYVNLPCNIFGTEDLA